MRNSIARNAIGYAARRTVGYAARNARIAATLGLGLVAAGCVANQSTGSFGPGGRPSAGIEGNWAPADGNAIATCQNGAFVNRAVDTGQAFTAGGRYTYTGGNRVEIAYTSVVRQTQVNVNCLVVTPAQMNCTTADGANFQLFRRA